jgi:HK97 family phage portal protein
VSFLSAVRSLFGSEGHAIDKRDLWGRGVDFDDFGIHAGVSVTQESAQRMVAVYRCISILAEGLGAMPWGSFRDEEGAAVAVPRPMRWLETPNPETTPYEFKERVTESLAADGNAYVLITARDALGYPTELWTLHPRDVTVKTNGARTWYEWGGTPPVILSRFGPDNPMGDVLHIRLRSNGGPTGVSPLEEARQAIGLGLVSEKTGARFFGKGAQMQGVIQMPAVQSPALAREYTELMRASWKERHSGSESSFDSPGILTGGATWQSISVTPEQAQFLDTRRFQVEEIARLYGIPPHMVGSVERTTSWGSGIEAQSIGYLRFTLLPWIVRTEQAFSQLLPRGQYVKLNQRGLLRGDSSTEADVASKLLMNGVVNFDDVRAWYELPKRPGGSRFMIPSSQQLLDPAGIVEKTPVPAALAGDTDDDDDEEAAADG